VTRGYRFVQPVGVARCKLSDGSVVTLPVVAGIFKYPPATELGELLSDEDVARKYTRIALEKAAWQVLKEFPRDWLRLSLDSAQLRPGRRRALRFLLGLEPSPFLAPPGGGKIVAP
jgi:hypothetical protein